MIIDTEKYPVVGSHLKSLVELNDRYVEYGKTLKILLDYFPECGYETAGLSVIFERLITEGEIQSPLNDLRKSLKEVPSDVRVDIFNALTKGYCINCGDDVSKFRCSCY